jgi:protein-L-isoaspartate(D-aspartate) O-methyltransferase
MPTPRPDAEATLVAAAAPRVSPALVEQLIAGGRLVQPLGPGGDERVAAFDERAGRLVVLANLTAVHVVPLRGKFGVG